MDTLKSIVVYNRDVWAQQYLLRLIRRMCYGDALTGTNFRLEYRQPVKGVPHYLLIRSRRPIAAQCIEWPSWLDEIQQKLAIYLAIQGANRHNTKLRVGGARTPVSFQRHNHLPPLFLFEFQHNTKSENRLVEQLSPINF